MAEKEKSPTVPALVPVMFQVLLEFGADQRVRRGAAADHGGDVLEAAGVGRRLVGQVHRHRGGSWPSSPRSRVPPPPLTMPDNLAPGWNAKVSLTEPPMRFWMSSKA